MKDQLAEVYFQVGANMIEAMCENSQELLDEAGGEYEPVAVKAGYCPLEFHRDIRTNDSYWVAKTFLITGMRGTPESSICNFVPDDALFSQIPLLVWLHLNGFPCFYKLETLENGEAFFTNELFDFDWIDQNHPIKKLKEPPALLEI
jgi:hypothetical protein